MSVQLLHNQSTRVECPEVCCKPLPPRHSICHDNVPFFTSWCPHVWVKAYSQQSHHCVQRWTSSSQKPSLPDYKLEGQLGLPPPPPSFPDKKAGPGLWAFWQGCPGELVESERGVLAPSRGPSGHLQGGTPRRAVQALEPSPQVAALVTTSWEGEAATTLSSWALLRTSGPLHRVWLLNVFASSFLQGPPSSSVNPITLCSLG